MLEQIAASLNTAQLVEELRDERDAWKGRAKRNEKEAKDLRDLLGAKAKKRKKRTRNC